ncbi:hypothetical protein ONE63_006528 [Megalurothrips usitatus]|uniref:Uncharacterized protein n=1 Tax=Megalurothrips usitatus TaxID=439358 RepID=A0AAV7XW79_9NEOP|nr:hypothetical protein ONE63_006528 [Megalurothrips usitatus]
MSLSRRPRGGPGGVAMGVAVDSGPPQTCHNSPLWSATASPRRMPGGAPYAPLNAMGSTIGAPLGGPLGGPLGASMHALPTEPVCAAPPQATQLPQGPQGPCRHGHLPHGGPPMGMGHAHTHSAFSTSMQDIEMELQQHIQQCSCTCDHMGYGNYMDYQVSVCRPRSNPSNSAVAISHPSLPRRSFCADPATTVALLTRSTLSKEGKNATWQRRGGRGREMSLRKRPALRACTTPPRAAEVRHVRAAAKPREGGPATKVPPTLFIFHQLSPSLPLSPGLYTALSVPLVRR